MEKLGLVDYGRARAVFQPLDHILAVTAVLDGLMPGATVYVDNPAEPRSALIYSLRRFYLAGDPDNAAFNGELRRFFEDKVYPEGRATDAEVLVLYYAPNGWSEHLTEILPEEHPIAGERRYLRFKGAPREWRSLLPVGFELRRVDEALLRERELEGIEDLEEEMCSERASVADFLAQSFGVCLVHEKALVGWCLSEYNSGNRCEIGIGTAADFRQRGLATLMTLAFIEVAHEKGVTEIGWHCYADNQPSVATALKAGFEEVLSYPSATCFFNPALHAAICGYHAGQKAQDDEALHWYQQAAEQGGAPVWLHWEMACAYARQGELETALAELHRAVDDGFIRPALYQNEEDLAGVRALSGWPALMERLSQG